MDVGARFASPTMSCRSLGRNRREILFGGDLNAAPSQELIRICHDMTDAASAIYMPA